MSQQSQPITKTSTNPDAISCVGILLLLLFGLFIIRTIFLENERANDTPNIILIETVTPAAPVALVTLATRTAAPTWTTIPLPSTTPFPPTISPPLSPTSAPILVIPTRTPQPTTDVEATIGALPSPTQPLPTPISGGSFSADVPILMYHYLSEPPPDADIYRTDLSVSPTAFREQLTYLRDNDFTTIDLYDLSLALANQATLPTKPVILTFDDGYRDNYENAYPILREFGMKGTFFIITDIVNSWHEGYMTWPMIEEMAANGMRMEIHTRSHPDLSADRERDFVVDEIAGAQQTLAEHIGYSPRFLSYPGGFYDDQTLEVVHSLELWGAVTTRWGGEHTFLGRFELRRLRMRYTTDLPIFIEIVNLRVN